MFFSNYVSSICFKNMKPRLAPIFSTFAIIWKHLFFSIWSFDHMTFEQMAVAHKVWSTWQASMHSPQWHKVRKRHTSQTFESCETHTTSRPIMRHEIQSQDAKLNTPSIQQFCQDLCAGSAVTQRTNNMSLHHNSRIAQLQTFRVPAQSEALPTKTKWQK